jgi:diguanylate cyclase (GGDEF)-like protein
MAGLMFSFDRDHSKSYLRHWTMAWALLAIANFGDAIWLRQEIDGIIPRTALTVTAAFVASIAGYLFIGLLAFGVYEVTYRRPARIRESRQVLTALGVVGFATAVPLLLNSAVPPAILVFTTIGFRSALVVVTFAVAAIRFWRARARGAHFGFVLLALALLACAADQVWSVVHSIDWLRSGQPMTYSFYASLGEVLLTGILGVAMVGCLLADEREVSALATVEIEHLAYHDALTGLPNRPLFIDRLIVSLAQAPRAKQKLAVFFLDLDRFKDVNDSLGHSVGDALLKAVAERIRSCVREGDTVARFGGDEFTLLVPRLEHVEDVGKIAQKILETLKIPFLIADRELFAPASIGISIYPGDGTDAETLVRNADTAMYRAKEQGRDNYQLYAPAMNVRALERLALENMLRKALAQQELRVFYQPMVDLRTSTIVGVEALVRWQHPELGLLSPAHFISVAELSGLIVPIGNWVLRTACRQTRQWQKRFGFPMRVSVNLSARQFQQPDLAIQVLRALQDSGLEPSALDLEITESSAMQNAENTIHALRDLKALGIRIAMDDFGTGYSSLSYLKRFPIDTLKLDKSFVEDVCTDSSDAAIAEAVVLLAHSLNLSVVAEGVETEEQLEFFRRLGCDHIQGYLFSAPVSAVELEALLVENRAVTA